MGEPAKKLAKPAELPPLAEGEIELMGLQLPALTRIGRSCMKGAAFSDFDITGVIARLTYRPNGTVLAHVRVGGEFVGGDFVGSTFRQVIFFQGGHYGAVPA